VEVRGIGIAVVLQRASEPGYSGKAHSCVAVMGLDEKRTVNYQDARGVFFVPRKLGLY
jgi:hypothetical protein